MVNGRAKKTSCSVVHYYPRSISPHPPRPKHKISRVSLYSCGSGSCEFRSKLCSETRTSAAGFLDNKKSRHCALEKFHGTRCDARQCKYAYTRGRRGKQARRENFLENSRNLKTVAAAILHIRIPRDGFTVQQCQVVEAVDAGVEGIRLRWRAPDCSELARKDPAKRL